MSEQHTGLATMRPVTSPPRLGSEVLGLSVREQFAAFYKANYTVVLAAVMHMGASRSEAEDAVSEAMRDLLTKWVSVRSPGAYVRTAALRGLIKSRQRDRALQEKLAGEAVTYRARCETDGTPTAWADAEFVRQILDGLPPTQREVLALVCDELDTKEIAELLGKTPGAVRQNLMEARRRAREALSVATVEQRRPAAGKHTTADTAVSDAAKDGTACTTPTGEETR